MNNELKIFENSEFGKIREVTIDGEPWFVGKDVAEILGYERGTKAVVDHVDDDDRLMIDGTTQSQFGIELGQRGGWLINESGLYSLIMSSKLESAKRFKHWVTSEVLPQIRKTGSYNMPKTYSEALRQLADKAEENEKLQIENQEMKPKADFYDDVIDSPTAIDIGSAAKVLNMGIGRNSLFKTLRDKKILQYNNRPYQSYIDKGYFRCVESSYMKPNGDTCINIKTVVFQKGLDYIRKILKGEQ